MDHFARHNDCDFGSSMDNRVNLSRRDPADNWTMHDEDGLAIAKLIFTLGALLSTATCGLCISRRHVLRRWISIAGLVCSVIMAYDLVSKLADNPITILYAVSAFVRAWAPVVNGPVLDPSMYPVSATLEREYQAIRKEVATLDWDTLPLTKNTYGNGRIGRSTRLECANRTRVLAACDPNDLQEVGWRLLLVNTGHARSTFTERARESLPTLVDIIEKNPVITAASISMLPPRSHIPAHIGYSYMIKRLMLGVEVPQANDQCFLCVNGEKGYWLEGKTILFDDTFPHSVTNLADEQRVVVYMDVLIQTGNPLLDTIAYFIHGVLPAHLPFLAKFVRMPEYRSKR